MEEALHMAYLGDYGDFNQESIERVAEEASRRNCNLKDVIALAKWIVKKRLEETATFWK